MKYSIDKLKDYIIKSEKIKARISNYGCTLLSLWVRDSNGDERDVVLGYERMEDYFDNPPCFGSCVLPNANRIEGARFSLNGVEYKLDKNDGENNLHSGFEPLHKRLWEVTEADDTSVSFHIECEDMDMGMPGKRSFDVKYSVEDNRLRIDYYCTSDKDTLFNPTNHSYFNLAGHDKGDILSHKLTINADTYTPCDEHAICDGTISNVASTPMDFRTAKEIGAQINDEFEQLIFGNGYDHNYILNDNCSNPLNETEELSVPAASLSYKDMSLNIYTSTPCIQLYTGNYLSNDDIGKGGCHYAPRSGVALETQFAPNSINTTSLIKPILNKNTRAHSSSIYEFC